MFMDMQRYLGGSMEQLTIFSLEVIKNNQKSMKMCKFKINSIKK